MTRILARDVLRIAAEVCDVEVEVLIGRRRDYYASRPRGLACKAIRALCPHVSYPEIGRMLGRDYSTIIKAVAVIDRTLPEKPELAAAYETLIAIAGAPEVAALDQRINLTAQRLSALTARRESLLSTLNPPGA